MISINSSKDFNLWNEVEVKYTLKISTFVIAKKVEDENRVDQREPQIKHRFFKPSFWKKYVGSHARLSL